MMPRIGDKIQFFSSFVVQVVESQDSCISRQVLDFITQVFLGFAEWL
jgi:hypothetical protein